MKRSSAAIWLAGIFVAVVSLWLLAQPAPRQTSRLPDGSILSLESVKLGRTNKFLEGNLPERIFSRFIPAKGVQIFRWHWQHPNEFIFSHDLTASLTFQFKLSGLAAGTNRLQWGSSDREFRAVLTGGDGFDYINEFGSFHQHRDGLYGYLSTPIYPRDSRTFNIRIERRDSSARPWETLAEFTHHQRPAADQNLSPEPEPRLRTVAGLQIQLGDVTVRSGTFVKGDIWNQTVLIPWQVTRDGIPLTNWNAHDLVISDSNGNADHFGVQKAMTNGWIIDRLWRSLDPRKVWEIQAGLAQDSDFAATNLYTVRLPYPLKQVIETNLGGFPLRLGFVNRDMLSVQLLSTNRPDLRLTFVRAEDELGRDIADWTGAWGQFQFRKQLRPADFLKLGRQPVLAETVVVTFAIHQNIQVEFTVKPSLLSPAKMPGPDK